MLSRILKSLEEITIGKLRRTHLPSEFLMSLSFIESGCFAVPIDGKTAFVFKGNENEIDALTEATEIALDIECILRLEFPSVRMGFDLKDKSGKPYRFILYFGVESEEEMELLDNLKKQTYFDLLFFSPQGEHSKRVKMNEGDREKIKKALAEVEKVGR